MYIHKHTVFWVFCLFVPSCLLLVVWNKSGVVGVTNLYQFLWLFFFLQLKKEALIKILFGICLKIRKSRQNSIFWKNQP